MKEKIYQYLCTIIQYYEFRINPEQIQIEIENDKVFKLIFSTGNSNTIKMSQTAFLYDALERAVVNEILGRGRYINNENVKEYECERELSSPECGLLKKYVGIAF